jgi:hypothetical protein
MRVRIYWTICAIFALINALLIATGNFTMLTAVVMGQIAFGLVFMGMMNVLPGLVAHPAAEQHTEPKRAAVQGEHTAHAKSFGVLESA